MVLEGAKIDFYDTKNKAVHVAQVKYYLYLLVKLGIDEATGLLEYPKLRKTREVFLNEADKLEISQWESNIGKIVADNQVPERIRKNKCRKCSYFDFC